MTNKDPLEGVTLKALLTELIEHYGWQELGERIKINCFTSDPSLNSSLKFLRRTPWARTKVEALYLSLKAHKPSIYPSKPPKKSFSEK